MEILCNNDSNNMHVIYFGIKLYLISTNAVENRDVIIGYYSSQTVKILLMILTNTYCLLLNHRDRKFRIKLCSFILFLKYNLSYSRNSKR